MENNATDDSAVPKSDAPPRSADQSSVSIITMIMISGFVSALFTAVGILSILPKFNQVPKIVFIDGKKLMTAAINQVNFSTATDKQVSVDATIFSKNLDKALEKYKGDIVLNSEVAFLYAPGLDVTTQVAADMGLHVNDK